MAIGAFVLTSRSKAMAQEKERQAEMESQQELNMHLELHLNEDKVLLMEPESKPAKTISPAIENNPVVSKKSDPQLKSNEKNPLSFNFLYFIIQRFKISDIVGD
ncbi:MAG: hypothetical protein JST69_06050 [Bacteroidetes bacterium]|nr:hypothetical protein [Bacteroidota bacterium]